MNGMNNKRNFDLYGSKTKILKYDLESLYIYIYIYIYMIGMLFDIKNCKHKVFVKIPIVTCLMKLNSEIE